jgi:hypothetical protein
MIGGIKRQKKLCIIFQNCVYIYFFERNLFACTFIAEIRGSERKFGSCMTTTAMEDSKGSYIHEEEFIGMHVNMGNAETKSNGRRGM